LYAVSQGEIEMLNFSISGLNNAKEVAVAEEAVSKYREYQNSEVKIDNRSTLAMKEESMEVEERARRVLQGLTSPGPLPAIYIAELRVLCEAVSQSVKLEDLASRVGASSDKVTAHLSKLSARMKRIASPAELKAFSKAFLLLADIEPTPDGSKQYRLTPAGRVAVCQWLKTIDGNA
jgi:hypothetical protein